MTPSRYKQARTLVRRLCRLPGKKESWEDFRNKVKRLREHFERFNVDVSELCQWFFGLRNKYGDRNQPESFGALGDFLLEPNLEVPAGDANRAVEADEKQRDGWRLAVFDDLAGFRSCEEIGGQAVPGWLRAAMNEAAARQRTPTAQKLFDRLRRYEPAHRLVLLKSAAEWVVARYQRCVKNWISQRSQWEKERQEWENQHPELTPEIREKFTNVFRSLVTEQGNPGVKSRRPRICCDERLSKGLDNCAWAGQRGHSLPCLKYEEFLRRQKEHNTSFDPKKFEERAGIYLQLHAPNRDRRMALLVERLANNDKRHRQAAFANQRKFKAAWTEYLKCLAPLGLDEQELLGRGAMPHCTTGQGLNQEGKIAGIYEETRCEHNKHTHLCEQYRKALAAFDPATRALEPLYREWRRVFLAPPRKAAFEYPSSRRLPMPKIFGERFHEVDLANSVVRLRLDDMPEGQWLEFGFTPWPNDYPKKKREVNVTSAHVNFFGSRARLGLRFDVAHAESRFRCSQDQIDELRRELPRGSQDQEFLDAARDLLLKSFTGQEDLSDLRILAVDLGEKGAGAAVFHGTEFKHPVRLEIIKINKLYAGIPAKLEKDERDTTLRGPLEFDEKTDRRGLRKEHVAQHLARLQEGVQKMAERRQKKEGSPQVTLRGHDFRGLLRHAAAMIRDWVRVNAARIAAAAKEHQCDLIVFESLRRINVPGYDQLNLESRRKKLSAAVLSFGRIRRKVAEKAVELGMRAVCVPDFMTSQVCSACGHEQHNKGRWRKNKKERRFKCECAGQEGSKKPRTGLGNSEPVGECSCRFECDSDENAARVLARVFWGAARGGIDLPIEQGKPAGAGNRRAVAGPPEGSEDE